MKQNPYPSSPRIKKYLKKNKDVFNKFNTIAKYDSILDNVIAKKLNIQENNIVFFNNDLKFDENFPTIPPRVFLLGLDKKNFKNN